MNDTETKNGPADNPVTDDKNGRDRAPPSSSGQFKNDPDDPSNPNEVHERYLRKIMND